MPTEREMLGYPRPPVLSENTTRAGMEQEVERWRNEMADALQLDINTIEHWNRVHPESAGISTAFEREMLAWVKAFPSDRPLPTVPATLEARDAD